MGGEPKDKLVLRLGREGWGDPRPLSKVGGSRTCGDPAGSLVSISCSSISRIFTSLTGEASLLVLVVIGLYFSPPRCFPEYLGACVSSGGIRGGGSSGDGGL